MKYAVLETNHTPTLSFTRPEQNKKLKELLNHFRRWRDCTEHVQQAVKPLGFPRWGLLSPEGFQWIAPCSEGD